MPVKKEDVMKIFWIAMIVRFVWYVFVRNDEVQTTDQPVRMHVRHPAEFELR